MQLIFLCPAIKKAIGGVKVIYRQAGLIHQLGQAQGFAAAVMHPNRWFFRVQWFDSKVPLERAFFKLHWLGKPSFSNIAGVFDARRHMVVIPELWARKYGAQLADMGVTYAIYVQNGYYIAKGRPADLDRAYQGARCILTISEDASRCVALAFPGAASKILRVHYSVDARRFKPDQAKENIITYMPRKLADHSSKVIFFLRHHLPAHWQIVPIDGMTEVQVAALLERSKIFMAFSHFEGCPLPPLEAALSGNQVIGYTGQGAKEYWVPEIFEEVASGDVAGFARRVLDKVQVIDQAEQFDVPLSAIRTLADTYSEKQERSDMLEFLNLMGLNVNGLPA